MRKFNIFEKQRGPVTEWAVGLFALTVCYFLAAQLGLLLSFQKTNASPVWPASGVALGALLLFGRRFWPGIFLGALSSNLAVFLQNQTEPLWLVFAVSAGIAVGNTLEAVVGAWVLRLWLVGRNPFDRPEDVFRFGLIALLMSLVSAINGPIVICASHLVPWALWPVMALTWWLGDFTGVLAVAPLVLLSRERRRFKWSAARIGEASLALVTLIGLSATLFNAWWPRLDWMQWKYFALAPLLWVATRFGRRETALAFFLFSAIAVWGAVHAGDTFGTISLTKALLTLQSFVGFAGLTTLVIAAAVAERRTAEDSLRLVVEAAPNGMVMVDSVGRITLINAQMERLFGYTRHELLGQSIEVLIPQRLRAGHPEMRRGFMAHPQTRAMGAGRDLFGRRKDGSEFPVEIGLNPIKTPKGQFVLASVIDITERKRAEAILRQSEERFRVIAETVPSMLFTATPEGACDYTSKSFQEYIGATAEEAMCSGWIKALHPDDLEPAKERWQHSIRTGELVRMEHRFRRRDGQYRWFLGEAHPVLDESGRIVKWVGALTDIHQEKEARDLLEATVAERTAALKASLNSMEELLYTIAHDLRAPNRAMKGFAQLVQVTSRDRLDATSQDYLNRISEAAERNDQLIRDLLAYGRISHEAVPLAPIDAGQIVEAVLHTLENEIQRRHAHVHLAQEWPRVMGNEPMLKQILINLVANALQYVPADKEPEVEISAGRENGKALLRVKDNGIGISPDQLEKVFKPFVRLPNDLQVPGTGMGLAIVKKAAERMHGQAGMESTPGAGSCFWVQLPAA